MCSYGQKVYLVTVAGAITGSALRQLVMLEDGIQPAQVEL